MRCAGYEIIKVKIVIDGEEMPQKLRPADVMESTSIKQVTIADYNI